MDEYDYENFIGMSCKVNLPTIHEVLNMKWKEYLDKKLFEINIVVDCRSAEQTNIIHFNHFENLIHMPYEDLDYFSEDDLINKLKLKEKEDKFFVFCRRGRKSIYFVEKLKKKGFNPINIEGGLKDYRNFTKKVFPLI